MNFDRLRFVAERADMGEAREAALRRHHPRAARRVPRVLRPIGRRVITEFNYRLSGRDRPHIFVGIATESREDAMDVAARRCARAATKPSISATTNWRSCTCGIWSAATAPDVRDEHLCRFEFPERPGALLAVPRRRLEAVGTSVSSTIGIMAPTSAGCWPASRCPRRTKRRSKRFWFARLRVPARARQRGLRAFPQIEKNTSGEFYVKRKTHPTCFSARVLRTGDWKQFCEGRCSRPPPPRLHWRAEPCWAAGTTLALQAGRVRAQTASGSPPVLTNPHLRRPPRAHRAHGRPRCPA